MLKQILKEKNMTIYKLAKDSSLPYSTISDLVNEKSSILSANAETVYKISKALCIPMETVIEASYRSSFDIFKSNVCHELKEKGDINFIIDNLSNNEVSTLFKKKWYPECLYLLAMIDYISKENDIPLCTNYDELRKMKLQNIIFPNSITVMDLAGDKRAKEIALQESIPEFLKYNIVESEIRNVV